MKTITLDKHIKNGKLALLILAALIIPLVATVYAWDTAANYGHEDKATNFL